MSTATSFRPLINRIEEVLLSGSGNSRTLATGSFGLWAYYEGKDLTQAAKDALVKPQLAVHLASYVDHPKSMSINGNRIIYDVVIEVQAVYRLQSEVLQNRRRDVEIQAIDDSHAIRKALTNPTNLTNKSDGTPTGLVSGMLEFQSRGKPFLDFKSQSYRQVLYFRGICVLTL